ncbi:ATP-binding cassette domain-containing protein [Lactobacillus delbrueckii]|uniref:ATP-binding cassette domain-containing protein n=1 Tax=Lactobacillus delbrueckii TaxID=1584 RepID=UPI000051078B|nr:ATP-binding cassette domain-containing protein [Lactobacillus delbrueckii]ABJ59405.1 ABC-type multidrug transport system, ATPase component [Lactobacillus delbrueckii subsp. bulgaricus ATCC BAA-365]MBT8938495.1 ABC transporter ATP-binding protein [Lactobacillus delbrueckii subsp. bulgaricus]
MFIELKNVNKVISGRQLLSQVNCEIEAGQIAVFEGINGSGKTLTLKTILGLMKVDGEVLVAGKQVKPQDAYPVKAGILIENPSLITDFTATQNMELDEHISATEIAELLKYFDLSRFPNEKVKKFSLGMKQKLGIAEAFLGSYPLIVLDEPTNALDSDSIDKLVDLIKLRQSKGCTFVIASHDRDFVEQVATKRFKVEEGVVHEA